MIVANVILALCLLGLVFFVFWGLCDLILDKFIEE